MSRAGRALRRITHRHRWDVVRHGKGALTFDGWSIPVHVELCLCGLVRATSEPYPNDATPLPKSEVAS